MGTLEGKVAFISGVARAQGRSHAVRLAEQGADIIGIDLAATVSTTPYPGTSPEDLEETARLIKKTGRRAFIRQADVRDLAAVTKVADDGVAEFGRLDIACINAAIFSMGALIDLDEQTWNDVIDINLTGAWHTAKAVVPHIKAGGRGGSVVFTASAVGVEPMPYTGHYSASKAAVIALVKTLAQELGPEHIRVNAVAPGVVDTLMVDNDLVRMAFMPDVENPSKEDAGKPDSAFSRINALPNPWVLPIDISEAVSFLCSDAARYISGIVLPVDNGYLAKG